MADKFEYPKYEPGTGSGRVYEDDLARNSRWAFNEGGLHFENASRVHNAMRKIARRLEDLQIDYAVVGGMALFHHGFRRFTEDVDLLVTSDDLIIIHRELEGTGYRPPFANSKNLRDTEFGVRVEFLVAGEFPGDGKPKPVAFPAPADVSEVEDGVRFINLQAVIELKLASGMTNIGRISDLGDVSKLIRVAKLPRDFAEKLNPYVRDRYIELWDGVSSDPYAHENASFDDYQLGE
jgi:hypothetical protein